MISARQRAEVLKYRDQLERQLATIPRALFDFLERDIRSPWLRSILTILDPTVRQEDRHAAADELIQRFPAKLANPNAYPVLRKLRAERGMPIKRLLREHFIPAAVRLAVADM